MIENMLDIGDKIFIIKHANLDDAKILDRNYLHLIHDAYSTEEEQQFTILHTTAQERIQELSD